MKTRKIGTIVRGENQVDGAGVKLRRILGPQTIPAFDPFIMLDGFDSTNPNDYIKGFPWHPHRGIETITYLISGSMEHRDSLGNIGHIKPLGSQWMTAGSGIIHQEMPLASERMLGCQLWVNLPAEYKMADPAYRDISPDKIAVVEDENATVRVLSGNYKDAKGALQGSYSEVTYLDVEIPANGTWQYNEATNDKTLFIYLFEGSIITGEGKEEQKGCAVLYSASNTNGEEKEVVEIKAGENGARFALLSAKPLKEPVAWGGPIVMNSREELEEAFDELNTGHFIK